MFGLCSGECVVEEIAPPILPGGEGNVEDGSEDYVIILAP